MKVNISMFVRAAVGANFPMPAVSVNQKSVKAPHPWDTAACSACSSELDCRSNFEFCAPNGCCERGECETDAQCSALFGNNPYYTIQGFDSYGSDINPLHPHDSITVLKTACDSNPDCVGFTSYGLMKHTVQHPRFWYEEPPIPDLPHWTLYLKKTAVDQQHPQMKLPKGIKSYCSMPYTTSQQHDFDRSPSLIRGTCKTCLACSSDDDCPNADVCDTTVGCCVNNPCYVATAENGKWIDGHYSRDPQCNCPPNQKFCCLSNFNDPLSAYCSETPCSEQDAVRACMYICEDPSGKYDSTMCKANEVCCNRGDGPPGCCPKDHPCSDSSNACSSTTVEPQLCAAPKGTKFRDVYCAANEQCCNSQPDAPPVCCSDKKLGCYTGINTRYNGCNLSDLK